MVSASSVWASTTGTFRAALGLTGDERRGGRPRPQPAAHRAGPAALSDRGPSRLTALRHGLAGLRRGAGAHDGHPRHGVSHPVRVRSDMGAAGLRPKERTHLGAFALPPLSD